MSQRTYIKLSPQGQQQYKQISYNSYKIMFSWCLFGGAMGYTAAQFLPFIKSFRKSPNLKRNRYTIFTLITLGCSYHGYKKSLQIKKLGQRRLSKDQKYILKQQSNYDSLQKQFQKQIKNPKVKEFKI